MAKQSNWRHKIPEAPVRKTVKASRVRLRSFGLTYIISLEKRLNAAMRAVPEISGA